MLGCAADARGDVDRWCDAGAGLADLVTVWTPTIVGDRTAAADLAAEFFGERLERRKCFFATHGTTAGYDDRSRREGDSFAEHHAVTNDRTHETVVDIDGQFAHGTRRWRW